MTDKSKLVEGRVLSISFGGDGVLRHEGKVIFVPFVATGDVITTKITQDKKSFAKGVLVEVQEASTERAKPRCPYFGQCGGCQLQHLNYEAQLEAKRNFVIDALLRIGGLSAINVLPVVGTPQQWEYRRHIKLHGKPSKELIALSYVLHDGKGEIQVSKCPIFSGDRDVIDAVSNLLNTIRTSLKEKVGDVSIMKNEQRFVLLFDFPHMRTNLTEFFDRFVKSQNLFTGILWRARDILHEVGDLHLNFMLDDLTLKYSPLSFVQAHPEQSANLYRALFERVERQRTERILDVYCGIGATSLILARTKAAIVGIEENPQAVILAHDNAQINAIENVSFIKGDADVHVASFLTNFRPDVIVVNPPRTGLGKGVKDALIGKPPKRLFYISCMPSTLARDLKELVAAGFKVVYCQPFDLFPQTTHVETLVELEY